MIDWNDVDKDSETAWVALTERLIGKAQALLTGQHPDADALRGAQVDLGEMVSKATLSCPLSAIDAARRASDQITRALEALAITDLERRNDRLDAVKARMSSAANELRAEAASIRLEPIQDALTLATSLVTELKALKTEVESLTKAEIPDRIGAVVRQARKVLKTIEEGLESVRA